MDVHYLPRYTTTFVGREAEFSDILNRLDDPVCRLLNVIGPGGIGKTRLAIQILFYLQTEMGQTTYFIPLQGLNSHEFLVSAIADAIGLVFMPGKAPRQQLLEYLSGQKILLVLDNFEHLLEDKKLITDVLHHSVNVCLLVTSRVRLNLVEEWVYELHELDYPAENSNGKNVHYGAVQLFLHRAKQAGMPPRRDSNYIESVIRICQLVGGLPLGIELAASRVRTIPVEEIVREVEKGLDVLKNRASNLETRHRDIRLTIEPTWMRLPDELQNIFMCLSVFRGSFSRESAEIVAGASLNNLSELVNVCLLQLQSNGRYSLHELLRQYAGERLREHPEKMDAVLENHARYYLNYLAEQEELLETAAQLQSLTDIQQELDNIRVAWQRAVDHNEEKLIGDACHALWLFYDIRAKYQEGAQVFERAAIASGLHAPNMPDSTVLAKLMIRLGGYYYSLNQPDGANHLMREGLAILRRNDAGKELGFALIRQSEVAMFWENNYLLARDYLEESLELCQTVNYLWGKAYNLRWLAYTYIYSGEYELTAKLAKEALAIYEARGDVLGKALTMNLLIVIALAVDDYEMTIWYSEQGLKLSHEIGLRWNLPFSHITSAAGKLARNQIDEGLHQLHKGWYASLELQFVPFILHGLVVFAFSLKLQKQFERALMLLYFLRTYPVPSTNRKTLL